MNKEETEAKESEKLSIIVSGATKASFEHPDPDRNEDAFFVADEKSFGVFDGLGGYRGGEVASNLAKQTMMKVILSSGDIKEAFSKARKVLHDERRQRWEYKEMDSTALVVVLGKMKDGSWQAKVGNIGDSRLYLFRNGELNVLFDEKWAGLTKQEAKKLDELDSWEEFNQLNEELKAVFYARNIVQRTLGSKKAFSFKELKLRRGDILLAMTDGVPDNLTWSEIEKITIKAVEDSLSSEGISRQLVESAYQKSLLAKGRDFFKDLPNPRVKPDDLTVVAAVVV